LVRAVVKGTSVGHMGAVYRTKRFTTFTGEGRKFQLLLAGLKIATLLYHFYCVKTVQELRWLNFTGRLKLFPLGRVFQPFERAQTVQEQP